MVKTEKSGLLQAAIMTVKLYHNMIEQLSSDPQSAQSFVVAFNESINVLTQEIKVVEAKLEEIESFKKQLANLGAKPCSD